MKLFAALAMAVVLAPSPAEARRRKPDVTLEPGSECHTIVLTNGRKRRSWLLCFGPAKVVAEEAR